jgi:secreted PhoX family phosphatase
MNRRTLLIQLLGLGVAGAAATAGPGLAASARNRGRSTGLPFQPVPGPIPLPSDGLNAAQQRRHYARISLQDRLVVPQGYRSDVLLSWGDQLGQGRFGFNNDYLAFTPLGENKALLTVNFEYISPRPWCV